MPANDYLNGYVQLSMNCMMYSIRPKLHDAIFPISGFHDSIFPNFEVFTTQFFPIGPVRVLFPIGQGKSLHIIMDHFTLLMKH
jgi:hypothetical protein